MPTVTRLIARAPDTCWRSFIDLDQLVAWVPNLRRVRVITTHPDGRPREVAFEQVTALTYTLVYTYDLAARRVSWAPRTGTRDAVRGHATFAPAGDGCLMTYELEGFSGRAATTLDEPEALVAAFARWMLR